MEFLLDIGLFTIKIFLVSVAVVLIIGFIASLMKREKNLYMGTITLTKLNDHYQNMRNAILETTLDEKAFKKLLNDQKKTEKSTTQPRVWVLQFDGDIAATTTSELREQVTAILAVAKPEDEVVVILESGGGIMPNYGLAASQLARLRQENIPLTICVDKIAASGGYMMAVVGNQILAAPFAITGSIGVMAMLPNFNRLLKKFDIDYLELAAGEYKRTLSVMGEITEKGQQKFMEDLHNSHRLFKEFVAQYRPDMDINLVSTGETWFGQEAIDNGLVDKLTTSDDYLFQRSKEAELFRIDYSVPTSVKDKMAHLLTEASDRILLRWWQRLEKEQRFRI